MRQIIMENPLSALDKTFALYTNNGPDMNGRTFVKVFQDSNLLGKDLSSQELDIIFSKIKTKGSLKINLQQFRDGVRLAAEKKKSDVSAVCGILGASTGPKLNGTKAQNVKLHDDKETYTGVYARGGPTTVDKGNNKVVDLSELTNRKEANVRGINRDIHANK